MKPKGCLTFITLAKLLAGVLCLMQAYACVAKECRFGQEGEGGVSTIVNGSTSPSVYFKEQPAFHSPGDIVELDGTYEAQLSPALWSSCSIGDDGYGMENITYDAISVEGGGNAIAAWATNVPGIYYAVRVYSDNNSGSWFRASSEWKSLGVQSTVESKGWKIQIKLYQTAQFFGNLDGYTRITPKESKRIGGMSIGTHTDSNNKPWWFEVTPASFSIPISASTCQAAMVNDGTNTVDFGEIMASDVRDVSFFPTKYFSIQLKGCNNVTAIQYKVSSKTAEGIDGIIKNSLTTSDAAAGIGASFEKQFTSTPVDGGKINDPAFVYVGLVGEHGEYETGTNSSTELTFISKIGRDPSTAVKPGRYIGVATFTINYY